MNVIYLSWGFLGQNFIFGSKLKLGLVMKKTFVLKFAKRQSKTKQNMIWLLTKRYGFKKCPNFHKDSKICTKIQIESS